jgi:hypothetical protein
MKHTLFRRRPRAGSTLMLVAGAVSCTLNVASGKDSAHWQDQVTITGSPLTGQEQSVAAPFDVLYSGRSP